MNISLANQKVLDGLSIISEISKKLSINTWIWGGMTIDIYEGKFLRDHDDLDVLVEDLDKHKDSIIEVIHSLGYPTEELSNKDLRVKNEKVRIHFGNVKVNKDKITWVHNGEEGIFTFPKAWLDMREYDFYDYKLKVSSPEFEYVLKTNPQILNKEWSPRGKDISAREYLYKTLLEKHINTDNLIKQIDI